MSEEHKFHFDTLCLHGGTQPDPTTGARAVPIYQTTSYQFKNTDHAANLFGLKEFGNIYTRIMNPTNDVVEQRLAALEGGVGALVVSSGQAAETFAILNLAKSGDHIVSSTSLYGGTYNLFHYTLPRLGIDVHLRRPARHPRVSGAPSARTPRPSTARRSATPSSTCSPSRRSPRSRTRTACRSSSTTLPPSPYLVRPIEWGADIVVHSTTKYIGGHGLSIGGVIVDSGKFDWSKSTRHAEFNRARPQLPRAGVLAALGPPAYHPQGAPARCCATSAPAQAPFNSFLNIQGLETLPVRMERHIANANAVADAPGAQPARVVGDPPQPAQLPADRQS